MRRVGMRVHYAGNMMGVSIEERHRKFMDVMMEAEWHLGFKGQVGIRPEVELKEGRITTVFCGDYEQLKGVRYVGYYQRRIEEEKGIDESKYDDVFEINFNNTRRGAKYKESLKKWWPKVIEAYGGYKAEVCQERYGWRYCGAPSYKNEVYNRLRMDPKVDVNGRNNIYALRSAQYWSEELCYRALGYGPEEVIRRLEGAGVIAVMRLMDGVYSVLNDNNKMKYPEFVAMNKHYKKVLDLA